MAQAAQFALARERDRLEMKRREQEAERRKLEIVQQERLDAERELANINRARYLCVTSKFIVQYCLINHFEKSAEAEARVKAVRERERADAELKERQRIFEEQQAHF